MTTHSDHDDTIESTPDDQPSTVRGPYPELAPRLLSAVSDTRGNAQQLCARLDALEREYGPIVYAEILFLLSHLRFDPDQARVNWQAIIQLQQEMAESLQKSVDVRTALVSYFVDVNRQLTNPKIIELRLFQETEASVYSDALTGLFNYRYGEAELRREICRSERFNTAFSALMVDIDSFKQFNDSFGHSAGNEMLIAVARALVATVRAVDTVARFGGEEFVVILPSTSKTGAATVAERIRAGVERSARLGGADTAAKGITVSVGVATYPADGLEAAELIHNADSAMYVAKRRGRNQVVLHGGDRRAYRRMNVALDGMYRLLNKDTHPITTLNVSEGGVLFRVHQEMDTGTLLDLELSLPQGETKVATRIRATVQLVRACRLEGDSFEYGARILEVSQQHWQILKEFLRAPHEDDSSAS